MSAADFPEPPSPPTEAIAPRSPRGTARRVARNTAVQAGGTAAARLATLAFYVVMAREIGQRGFGDFTFAVALTLFIALAAFGTDLVLTREIARERDRVHGLFWNAVAIRVTFGLLGVGIVVGVAILGSYSNEVRLTIAILALSALISLLGRTVHATLRGLEDMAPIGASIAVQWSWTAAVGIAALSFGGGLVAAAVAYLSGAVVGLVYVSISLLRRGVVPRPDLSATATRKLIWDSVPLALGGVFTVLLARLDTVILSALKGNAAVGLYSSAYKMFESTLFLTLALGMASYPLLSRLDTDTRPRVGEAYEAALKVVAVGLLPLAMVFVLFASPITLLVYGSDFGASASAMRLLGGSVALWGFFAVSMYALAAQDRQRTISWILAIGVGVNVVLNVVLIPPYSYDGAAAAMTVSLVGLTILMATFAQHATASRLSLRRIALGPLAGCAGMGVIGFGIGTGLGVLPIAVLAYGGIVLTLEKTFFPADVKLAGDVIRRRRALA